MNPVRSATFNGTTGVSAKYLLEQNANDTNVTILAEIVAMRQLRFFLAELQTPLWIPEIIQAIELKILKATETTDIDQMLHHPMNVPVRVVEGIFPLIQQNQDATDNNQRDDNITTNEMD